MKKILYFLLIIISCLPGRAQNKPANFAEVPLFSLCSELEDTLNSILTANRMNSADSCLILHVNTMDSTGKLLQVVVLPQKKCIPETYDFYIDNTFGIAFIDSVIVLFYGRSLIDKSFAVKTNSCVFVKVKILRKNTIEQSDEYFPKTIYIDFRDNK